MAALSREIFVGRLCKDGKTWKEGKQEVTSDVLKTIIQYVEPGHEIDVNVGGGVVGVGGGCEGDGVGGGSREGGGAAEKAARAGWGR